MGRGRIGTQLHPRRSVRTVISLGRKPGRGAPETGAATRVELRPLAMRAQSVYHPLIESDEEVERPDLPAVGVPGNLQVHTRVHRPVTCLGW
jgi:hypothetical protein